MVMSLLSSSESEVLAPSSSKKSNGKKTRKKKPPPQDIIDGVWRHFIAKKPSKPLCILPFSKVPQPTSLGRDNEVLNSGFERAALECSLKINKIIKECRRVNMRYRDPGFDLV